MMTTSLTEISGIGDVSAEKFSKVGINNVWDLLHFFPRKYNDYSFITKISNAKPGEVTLKVKISNLKGRYVRRGMHITEATATDDTGSIKLIWFNQPYRIDAYKDSLDYYLTGKLEFKSGRFAINSPATEIMSDVPIHTARIVPVYRESKDISAKSIRKAMSGALKFIKEVPEILPSEIIQNYGLLNYPEALIQIHFPDSTEKLQEAKNTMSFVEVFELMLASSILKQQISSEVAHKISINEKLAKKFVSGLPFKLTDAQRRTAWQVLKDIDSVRPANRLIEGDVGSGKTVVATISILMALEQGYQVAYLAPTEILARQHYEGIKELIKPLGYDRETELLVGSIKKSEKDRIKLNIKESKTRLIIGTHALFQGVDMQKLALIVIDEQHRFGVEQRKQLLKKTGAMPHIISMTATPIPRSLALTLYGELDISILDSMPPGRKDIITKIVSPNSRLSMEDHIEEEIKGGHQVYVVCPIIDSSSKLKFTSVEKVYQSMSGRFKNYKVTMLHGKLSFDEKNSIMSQFVAGNIDILVSTTVIEVGVNVPNSTIMVIESADRFGLAQLHQLRGRVGRSSDQAFCYVVPTDSKAPSKRLRAFTQINDGFKLAELDLEIRGPGSIYGNFQHGALDLRFTKLSDHKLLASARRAVNDFIDNHSLSDYPELAKKVRAAQAVIVLN